MGVPRYVLNFDEFMEYFNKAILELINKALSGVSDISVTLDSLKGFAEEINALLPDNIFLKLISSIELLTFNLSGAKKIQGTVKDIPPIACDYSISFKFDTDVYISALAVNQTAWKRQDTYSLSIGNKIIIQNATLKEIGEHKHFNLAYKVAAGTPISFVLHNTSGNSRQLIFDIEYIERDDN